MKANAVELTNEKPVYDSSGYDSTVKHYPYWAVLIDKEGAETLFFIGPSFSSLVE